MAKAKENNLFTKMLLFAALFFTLSAVPGINSEAEVGSVTMQSTAEQEEANRVVPLRDALPNAIPDGAEASEAVTVQTTMKNSSGQTITANVTASLVKLPATQRLGDLQPTPERTVVQYRIDGMAIQTNCRECPDSVKTIQTEGSVSGTIEPGADQGNFRNINLIVFRKLKIAAADLAKQAAEEVTRQQKLARCEINEAGDRLSGRAQLDCRVQRFSQLEDGKKEDYYERYIREDLHNALKSDSGAMRDHAMGLVQNLQQNAGTSSAFMTSSLHDMQMYGEAHKAAERIITMGRNSPTYARDVQKFQAANNYLASRGMALNQNIASALGMSDAQRATELAMVSEYEQKLKGLTQLHSNLLNGNQPLANGVRPIGQLPGRGQYGGPVTSYPQLLPPQGAAPGGVRQPPLNGGAQPRPGVPTAPGRGGFQVGAPVGSVR